MSYLHKILLIFTLILLPLISANSHEISAYADLDFLLKNSKIGKSIVLKLEKINKKNLEKMKIDEKKLKKDEEELIRNKNVLSNEIYTKKLETFKIKVTQFRNDNSESRKLFEIKKKEELNNFLLKIEPLINNYMEKNSINLLLDKKNIFIGSNNNDITNDLLKIIDENIN